MDGPFCPLTTLDVTGGLKFAPTGSYGDLASSSQSASRCFVLTKSCVPFSFSATSACLLDSQDGAIGPQADDG